MADEPSYPEGWNEVRGALQRGYRFKDFAEAIAFVNRLAEAAEEADHHPEIAVSWNAVTVRWWTHTKRAITERDIAMARRSDELARSPRTSQTLLSVIVSAHWSNWLPPRYVSGSSRAPTSSSRPAASATWASTK
jgi:4a-hydroxytetrahydrobiopterin dehydratase